MASALNIRKFPIAFLKECFDYDSVSGSLTWRARPLHHFQTKQEHKRWNSRYAGIAFGGKFCGHMIRPHQIAWSLGTGAHQEQSIDHINGDRFDNRLANLRDVDQLAQANNRKIGKNNKSGVMGVAHHKRGFYTVRMTIAGQHISKSFPTMAEAVAWHKANLHRTIYHANHGRLH